jgi:hypothetical protein
MRPPNKQKKELTLLVLSGEGERVHSLKLTRTRMWLLVSGWVLLLALAAVAGFEWSGEAANGQGARGAVAVSAEARQK